MIRGALVLCVALLLAACRPIAAPTPSPALIQLPWPDADATQEAIIAAYFAATATPDPVELARYKAFLRETLTPLSAHIRTLYAGESGPRLDFAWRRETARLARAARQAIEDGYPIPPPGVPERVDNVWFLLMTLELDAPRTMQTTILWMTLLDFMEVMVWLQ